jgi:hypothetical protein
MALRLRPPQEVLVPPLPSRGRPRKIMALARPTGVGCAGTHAGFALIPIAGADDWENSVESTA